MTTDTGYPATINAHDPFARHDVEYVSWRDARIRLAASGLCELTDSPTILAEWLEHGTLRARFRKLYSNGRILRDSYAEPHFFEQARLKGWQNLISGEFAVDSPAKPGLPSIRALDTEVVRVMLEELAPASDDEVARAEDEASAADGKPEIVAVPLPEAPKGNGGRKPDMYKWSLFYYAVIELAQNDRLSSEVFESAAALQRELEEEMAGNGPSDIRKTVQQVYNKFCRL